MLSAAAAEGSPAALGPPAERCRLSPGLGGWGTRRRRLRCLHLSWLVLGYRLN